MSMPANAFIYMRLSVEESSRGESSSISNQRALLHDFCQTHNITIAKEFVDDGYSGGNFQRPGFQSMIEQLNKTGVHMVVTKDLSRLGRDMTESSMYAERYFPERGIRYLTVSDGFDSETDNVLAPFQFAMNDVYIRDASRKIKAVMNQKRRAGQYCACPPFGYKKEPRNKKYLVPDENTAPIVQEIFELAANGMSTRMITSHLNSTGAITPLKYRVECRDNFSDRGASRAADEWNYTTVKRILKNKVYLGHTILGKTKKVSVKVSKQTSVPVEDWCVTENTHEPLVTKETFDRAADNLRRNTKTFYDNPMAKNGGQRRSIFRGLVFCANCGSAMSSGGTVYRDDRLSYWYLSCNNIPKRSSNHCENGARIKYHDLCEIVKNELNALIDLSDEEIDAIITEAIESNYRGDTKEKILSQIKASEKQLIENDKIIEKLYRDNVAGKISDDRLGIMIANIERDTKSVQEKLKALKEQTHNTTTDEENYHKFFSIVKSFTRIETLTADILRTFIDKIIVSRKTVTDSEEQQMVEIHYKFVGTLKR